MADNNETTTNDADKSDDKCIGNRRIRTILLCLILIAFSIFAAGFLFLYNENANDLNGGDGKDGMVHGSGFFISGLFFSMFFCLITTLLLFIPACNPTTNKAARIPGIGLIFASILYIFGWVWYISSHKERYYDLPGIDKDKWDATYLSWFGEALLYAATLFFIGVDILIPSKHLLHNEYRRLFVNLGILFIVSILVMPAYFILNDDDVDGSLAIAIGYLLICIITAIYLILFITTCCTCDCKDLWYVRIILGLGLIIGGIITSIGYYIFAGGRDQLGADGDDAKKVAYYIGYTILVAGLSVIWTLDIVWDDIKANNPS